jgi:hypothetical protein
VIVYPVLPPATVEVTDIFYGGRDYAALYRGHPSGDPETARGQGPGAG